MTQLDPNWQTDALDLSLGYFEQTLAVRGGYHRTDEGEHNEAILQPAVMCMLVPLMQPIISMVIKKAMSILGIPIQQSEPLSVV